MPRLLSVSASGGHRNVYFICMLTILMYISDANWAWGWTFQGLNVNDCGIGFEINAGVGSEVIIDGNISNTPIFVKTLAVSCMLAQRYNGNSDHLTSIDD